MSREQANTYKKYREANDPMGNLGWASKMAKNAVRQAPEAPDDIERTFGFSPKEKLLWRLIKIPRRYTDVETAGILPADAVRGFFRGLVAADALDLIEKDEGKALVPLEVKRIAREVEGKDAPSPAAAVKSKTINERVFRPDIGLETPKPAPGPAPAPAAAPPPKAAPAPVSLGGEPAPKGPLGGKDWEIKKRIDAAYAAMAKQDHFVFLGLKPGASEVAIKEAGLRFAREYHPDVLAGSALATDEDLKKKIDSLFKRLQEARSILNNPQKRADYEASVGAGGPPTSGGGGKVRRPKEAMVAFTKAETFFKKKDWRSAELHYNTAIELDEGDPKLQVALAWCIYLNETRGKDERVQKATRKLQDIAAKYSHGDAAYRLGLIARNEGKEQEAQKRFREALRLDPRHADAQREKRVSDRRSNKEKDDEKKGSGVLGALFKKR